MPWVRGLVYGFLLQKQVFDPRPVDMILVQIFLLVLWFFLVIIIQSILHTLILALLLTEGQVDETQEPSKKTMLFPNSADHLTT